MIKKWNGIMKLFEVTHADASGRIIFKQFNILNMLHRTGEQYILNAAFIGTKPDYFYFGLDGRSSIATIDTMVTISNNGNEPTTNGYSRVQISSSNTFNLSLNE